VSIPFGLRCVLLVLRFDGDEDGEEREDDRGEPDVHHERELAYSFGVASTAMAPKTMKTIKVVKMVKPTISLVFFISAFFSLGGIPNNSRCLCLM
jgi:hypothetical protein